MVHHHAIDRIDGSGNIREHIYHETEPHRALCGRDLRDTQAPMGNQRCKVCLRLLGQVTKGGL